MCSSRLHRYANVPLGNLGHDTALSSADILFARLLRHNRHVLWASDCARPDLGGAELDENSAWAEELERPSLNAPGAYRTVCVELEVQFGLLRRGMHSSHHRRPSSLMVLRSTR